jgi:16S rRNA (cytosine967-C5)-methyltransferase
VNTNTSLPLSTLLQHTAVAVQAVRDGKSLNDALAVCPQTARPGTQALAFHVLRLLGSAQATRQHLAPKAPPIQADALLITALALLWPSSEPGARYAEHTVVNQAVESAKKTVPKSAAFINAVLRRFVREREAIIAVVQNDPVAKHNHPQWWIQQLQTDWPHDWQSLLQASQQHPPMTLRVNARRSTAQNYVQRLSEAGLGATVVGPQAVRLHQPSPVQALPGFAQGDVSVQDAAAQHAATLLLGTGLPQGARVLDACAAPGGKTAHLLELADLNMLALDVDAHRLLRVNETLQRLGLAAQTKAGDASQPSTWWDGQAFDAILLDAPCSASGIVRRHPDVRWLRRASDIPALARIQAHMLQALWPLLKPGGRLLYCTCSIFKAEGQTVIDAFLQHQANARYMSNTANVGHVLLRPDNESPDSETHLAASPDGFFYALLTHRPDP